MPSIITRKDWQLQTVSDEYCLFKSLLALVDPKTMKDKEEFCIRYWNEVLTHYSKGESNESRIQILEKLSVVQFSNIETLFDTMDKKVDKFVTSPVLIYMTQGNLGHVGYLKNKWKIDAETLFDAIKKSKNV